jgi:hypothetical protein
MHTQRSCVAFRNIVKDYRSGCFPRSFADRRLVRNIINGWIAIAGFDAKAKI